ncbi:prepilin peptidase [Roseivivax sp. THAF30]|uniref:prepilin peptidase n=1 Tax=Roseivivax sp. THAF30 TaxID=2587852 RepID=UPI001268F362|nr:prepilin peptidase [Roseivivax sp. THAF30]QFT64160.1 Type IV leader peptidase family protein [Roseivivax sp. THAF30]
MDILSSAAWWFLPFALPICLYVCYTDLSRMKITNVAVLALALVFALVGLIALPFESYLWRYTHLLSVLAAGIALNAAGALGAGDAKFAAAAAPFIHIGDLQIVLAIFAVMMLAAFVAHRIARATALRRLAPHWESWSSGSRFPMGLALGPTLAVYLGLGALYGA